MELTTIKGVSDKREAELNSAGVYSVEDLVKHFPRSYLDMRKVVSLSDAVNNDFVLTKGTVVGISPYMPRRGKFSVFKVFCEQNGEPFTVVWFNQPYVRGKIKEGETYLFYGRLKNRYALSVVNPSFEPLDENTKLKGIVPVYSVKGSVTQKVMRNIVKEALSKVRVKSVVPYNLEQKFCLGDLEEAYCAVHNPASFDEMFAAADRIATEEYFLIISAFKIVKGDRKEVRRNIYNATSSDVKNFTSRFPFEFTEGQKKAVNDIFTDLKSPVVMNRLLQGDVGSGKTAVSLTAIFIAVKSGMQAVMLAPTEVLAKQNYSIISKYLPEYKIAFLSGSTPVKEKSAIKAQIKSGQVDIVVGTHAVLQDDVEFKRLSLCVCDEQQRFGVAQRSALVGKGDSPDVLIMSATPIPRTLSLVFYGDLDITTIFDKPVSRKEIQTGIVSKAKYKKMLEFVREEIKNGRQAYFVCPKIDGDEEGSVISVTEIFDELSKAMPELKLGLLHGRMKEAEKTAVMTDFKEKRLDGIVSTTVIEVGIDVPNATVMVIYGADRFGLSQLHQLRGRVGRSHLKSYCFLLSDTDNEKSIERLKTLKNNSDGFKIAESDFQERGGGDFIGVRQSGKFMRDLGNLKYSSAAIFLAKKVADEAFLSGEDMETVKKIAMERYESLKNIAMN